MKINFTPGPSQLYFTVDNHLREALRTSVGSVSHRSKQFEGYYSEAETGLKELLSVPSGFHIFFVGSATEIQERSIQNLVESQSFHFVNGAFSTRYHEIAQQLGKTALSMKTELGKGFPTDIDIPAGTEMIAVTHNETSTGVSVPLDHIHALKSAHPSALIVVDAVSSLPYPLFDYTKIDSVFFSVQKGFGLPSGLGVWIVNDKCLAQAERLQSKGVSIGTYHNLPTLFASQKKNQTPETPNVLGIYLLSKVVNDMLLRGITTIRKETEYKAAVLYHALDSSKSVSAFVANKQDRSKTVIVAQTNDLTQQATELLVAAGLHPGDGYGSLKKSQLRFANFPTHSKEQYELLADTLEKL